MEAVPFESFSYPFFDFTYKADHAKLVDAFLNPTEASWKNRGRKGLYVHIPFCDTICRFCPFVKSVGTTERIEQYVAAVETELRLIGATERFTAWAIDSIYIGGGTPSVLNETQLTRLFESIRTNLHLTDDCEITMEMEAKSVSREKLLCLKQLGATRVSFGLQTFDPEIRPILNLTPTQEQLDNTIALFAEIFPDNNMDMIVGLPGQDMEAMFRDLEKAAECGISSISIYPMDYVMTLPNFLDRMRRGEIPAPPDPATRGEMFYGARQFLRDHFTEFNIYSYGSERASPSRYMFATVYGGYYDEYIGVGCSAYTYIQGLMYQNVPSEQEYVSRLSEGRSPVSVASPYHAYEKGLVFFPKLMRYDTQELKQLDLQDIYQGRIDTLISEGLLTLDDTMLRLTPEGEKNYAPLMVEFFSESQRRLYRRICAKLKLQVGWNESLGVTTHKPQVKAYGGLTAMAATASTLRQKQAQRV